jgi:hypothetical protein
VYFKAAGQTLEYYVDMRRANDGTMWAMIPAPLPETKSFTYRIVTTDNRGGQASSFLMTAATASSCAESLTGPEQQAASNMVIGLTNASQPAVPTGFQCRGVVSYITTTGEMRPNEECRRLVAAGAQPGAAGAPGTGAGTPGSATGTGATSGAGTTGAGATGGAGAAGGGTAGGATAGGAGGTAVLGGGGEAALGTTTIVALTTAGLVAAGIIIQRNNNNNNNSQVSQSRP